MKVGVIYEKMDGHGELYGVIKETEAYSSNFNL